MSIRWISGGDNGRNITAFNAYYRIGTTGDWTQFYTGLNLAATANNLVINSDVYVSDVCVLGAPALCDVWATRCVYASVVGGCSHRFFTVAAVNGNGEGPRSTVVTVFLPPARPTAPTGLVVYTFSDCAVQLDGKCANFSAVNWSLPLSTGGVGVPLVSYVLTQVRPRRVCGVCPCQ